MTTSTKPRALAAAAALALAAAACDEPLATNPGPVATPTAQTNAEIARATLARLVAQDRGPEGAALLPKKLAVMGRAAAAVNAPSGTTDARALRGMIARLRALPAPRR